MVRQIHKVRLLIIGNELLAGRRQDKHFGHCQHYFSERGLPIVSVHYCHDETDELVSILQWLKRVGDVSFCFGGIGATPDDLTRAAAAKAFDLELIRHEEASELIIQQFGEQAFPIRIKMADLPEGSSLIPNEFNNIPGFTLKEMHFLPGFPQMAWPMLDWVVNHCYKIPQREQTIYRSLIIFDVRESDLVEILSNTQDKIPDAKISSLPKFPDQDRFVIEVGAEGNTEMVTRALELLRDQFDQAGFHYKEP